MNYLPVKVFYSSDFHWNGANHCCARSFFTCTCIWCLYWKLELLWLMIISFVFSGYSFDYIFDWTIMKYQQAQKSRNQSQLSVSYPRSSQMNLRCFCTIATSVLGNCFLVLGLVYRMHIFVIDFQFSVMHLCCFSVMLPLCQKAFFFFFDLVSKSF